VRVWSLKTWQCLHVFEAGGIVFEICLYENTLIAGVAADTLYLRLWDFDKREFWYDIELQKDSARLFAVSAMDDTIYCCTAAKIFAVGFSHPKSNSSECVVQ